MSEYGRSNAVQLRETRRCVGGVSVACAYNYLCYAAVVISLTSYSVLAVAASAGAEEVHGVKATVSHKEALVKKSDASCDVNGASKILSSTQQKLRNRSCLVSLSAADKLRTQKNFSFIDVRTPAEYDRYRIADSINIPLHLIKTKEFLKKLPVILVNDGHSTIELIKTCEELRQAGFDQVAVLDGGLFGWYSDKRVLDGDPFEQSKLNRMSAEDLFEVHAASNWSVIDVSTPGQYKDIRSWLPAKIVSVPIKSKSKSKSKDGSVAKIVSAILRQREKNPQGMLLLIADSNSDYERIDAQLKKSDVTSSVLRLDGGIKGYREQVKKQVAIWSHQNEINRPRRYAACPG